MKPISTGDLADWVMVMREILNKGYEIQPKSRGITIEIGYPKENLRTSLSKAFSSSKPDYKKALGTPHTSIWVDSFKNLDYKLFPRYLEPYDNMPRY